MKKTIRVKIRGRVQGVYFRSYAQDRAIELNLTGWVRNNEDGTVEAVFSGNPDDVDKIIEWCYIGSPYSKVEKVEIFPEKEDKTMFTFSIVY